MVPQHFSMIGLVLDVVGALLVAVEAIKIENFRAFRDRILKKMHSYTLSPRIVFVDKNGNRGIVNPDEVRPAESFAGLFMALHFVAGFLVVVAANSVLDGLLYAYFLNAVGWFLDLRWYWQVPVLLFTSTFGVSLVFWGLGEVVHVTLSSALTHSMKAIDLIEANTPTGTVGILGFVLLALGFLFQFIGTYLSLP